jgi:CRISPR-associated protein Cas1
MILISNETKKSLPIEDISSVIVNGFDITIHKQLIAKLGITGKPLIICEKYKPVSILLPVSRSTDTLLTRTLASLSIKMRDALWKELINAKCQNQSSLCEHLLPKSEFTRRIFKFAHSKLKNKEATCAKYHWSVFREFTGDCNFCRERGTGKLNQFLDYGYAVLLNLVLQRLLAYGLDPQFGVGHAVRERSAPLAYDVIEPFRPIIDYHLAHFVNAKENSLDDIKPFKELIATALERKYPYKGRTYDLASLVEQTCLSLRKAILSKNPRAFQPWTAKSLKWDG